MADILDAAQSTTPASPAGGQPTQNTPPLEPPPVPPTPPVVPEPPIAPEPPTTIPDSLIIPPPEPPAPEPATTSVPPPAPPKKKSRLGVLLAGLLLLAITLPILTIFVKQQIEIRSRAAFTECTIANVTIDCGAGYQCKNGLCVATTTTGPTPYCSRTCLGNQTCVKDLSGGHCVTDITTPAPTPYCSRTCLGNQTCVKDLSGGHCVTDITTTPYCSRTCLGNQYCSPTVTGGTCVTDISLTPMPSKGGTEAPGTDQKSPPSGTAPGTCILAQNIGCTTTVPPGTDGCIKYTCPLGDTNKDGNCDLRDTQASQQSYTAAECQNVSCGITCCQIEYTKGGQFIKDTCGNIIGPTDYYMMCKERKLNCSVTTGTPPPPQCINIVAYKDGNALSQADLNALHPGDVITLAFAPGGAATKVRFSVNAATPTETTTKNANGQFVWDYTLADTTSFTIEAQWFDGSAWH